MQNKRNPVDIRNIKQENKDYVDKDVIADRISENLKEFENISKYKNIPYNAGVSKLIRESESVRVLIQSDTAYKNEVKAYSIMKHLVNSGVAPSNIVILSLDECYLHFRGYSEEARELKKKLESEKKEILCITNIKDNEITNNQENVEVFWKDLILMLKKNRRLHLLLVFEDNQSKKWLFATPEIKKEMKSLKLKSI